MFKDDYGAHILLRCIRGLLAKVRQLHRHSQTSFFLMTSPSASSECLVEYSCTRRPS
jgi:hypothetical protein